MVQEDIEDNNIFEEELPNQQVVKDNTPELLKGLISNDDYPEEIKRKFPAVFSKDVVLSFQDENSERNKMIDFDIMKIDYLASIPYYDYDFQLEWEFNVARTIFQTKLERAKGFVGQKRTNERIVQQTQFGEQRNIRMDESEGKGSIFSRFFGRGR